MKYHFNRNAFNAMLANHGLNQETFAAAIGMSRDSLLRRLNNTDNFKNVELSKMADVCSLEEVVKAFFSCE